MLVIESSMSCVGDDVGEVEVEVDVEVEVESVKRGCS